MTALKEENERLKNVTVEIGTHYTTLLQGLREKDNKIAELIAKLEATESKLQDLQKSIENKSLSAEGDIQMQISPETHSEDVSCTNHPFIRC